MGQIDDENDRPRTRNSSRLPRDDELRQIESEGRALAAGIAAAQPGNRLGDVSAAVGGVIRGAGYQEINIAFGAHGMPYALRVTMIVRRR